MKTQILGLVLSVTLLSNCASINSVSLTPIPADRKYQVRSDRSKVIILGFNFNNDFVDDVVEDLKRQCPNGKVSGLLTKDENINYFLYIVWKKQLTATGYCVGNATANFRKPKARGAASDQNENSTGESEL